ncbi:MAG: LLM class flavin-dependent oxidoreductase [Pseudomonadota bacterium]
MKFAIYVPNFGAFGDARALAELARDAEDAGWDGFFIWDHVLWSKPVEQPVVEPWVALTAIAMATERIRIAPIITPLPRRRPWQLARQAASLDQLSGGRLIIGAGIGFDGFGDYSAFGETTDAVIHGQMLDEALTILNGLLSGDPFAFKGEHYQVEETQFLPSALQRPRIPIWLAGLWPGTKPFRRAAKWDGIVPLRKGPNDPLEPHEYRDMAAYITEHQEGAGTSFDIVGPSGKWRPTQAEVAAYEEVGVTWWKAGFGPNHSIEEVRREIKLGPQPIK